MYLCRASSCIFFTDPRDNLGATVLELCARQPKYQCDRQANRRFRNVHNVFSRTRRYIASIYCILSACGIATASFAVSRGTEERRWLIHRRQPRVRVAQALHPRRCSRGTLVYGGVATRHLAVGKRTPRKKSRALGHARSRWTQAAMIYRRASRPRRKKASQKRPERPGFMESERGQSFSAVPTTRRETSCFVSRECRGLEQSVNKNGGRSRELSSRERKFER